MSRLFQSSAVKFYFFTRFIFRLFSLALNLVQRSGKSNEWIIHERGDRACRDVPEAGRLAALS